MTLVAKSDHSVGNAVFASYVLQSNDLVFAFTAPYSLKAAASAAAAARSSSGSKGATASAVPLPHYDSQQACDFVTSHGLAVRAVGLLVEDAADAYHTSVKNGGIPVLEPTTLTDAATGASQVISEVKLYGDVVLRYVSGPFPGPFLAGWQPVTDAPRISYGLTRLDHAVGNVHELLPAVDYIMGLTGFHEFAGESASSTCPSINQLQFCCMRCAII